MILVACALALAGCGGKPAKTAAAPPPSQTITVAVAGVETLPRQIAVSGDIAPWQEAPVGAEVGGLTVVELYADEGVYVRQGQLLLKMDDTLLRAQLRQAAAGVASAKATLAQASADLDRAQELHDRGYLAQAALDQKKAAQGNAQAGVAQAEAAEAEARARLAQSSLKAPVSGLVSARKVVKGQIVAAGTELFRIVRDGRLELNAAVPEDQLHIIRAGMPASITADGLSTVAGTVRIVPPQVDAKNRLGVARITLTAPGPFRPGMFARGSIQVGMQPGVTVPQSAVIYRDSSPGVFVIDANNVAHYRTVATGVRSGDRIEIAQGVKPGERVALSGAGFLSDGDHVRLAGAR
ncbi:RND family efflux transporter MFP subunit [Caulobacter ginsengisoli]|uniref:RND family efflux transporter MFP subunit n=1 Tax=Caulobacter ginsengisoli TaxID=400775 RepID=A0ABU0IQN3_9CAUL|nr:efflux RND transporter periplasmic adaptor subunit [Caulobacter ginsengisoli]MDQ0464269.1 RND family efflux transporter MFP subunit [Caulobacter ginsengisoli]